jgi:hypothetical protein
MELRSLEEIRFLMTQFVKHPISCLTLATYFITNTGTVARKHIKDPELLHVIDIECFCWSTVLAESTPIINAGMVLCDRFFGGINYPRGGVGEISRQLADGLEVRLSPCTSPTHSAVSGLSASARWQCALCGRGAPGNVPLAYFVAVGLVGDVLCFFALPIQQRAMFVYHAAPVIHTKIQSYSAVAQECGSTIAYKANVTKILTEGEGADVAAIGVELADGTQVHGKCVVSNATRWDTFGRLLTFIPDNEAKFRERYTKSPSFITLHLGVKAAVLPVGSRACRCCAMPASWACCAWHAGPE